MGMMWKALTARKQGLFKGQLPRFETTQKGVVCEKLDAFQHLFGVEDGSHLPITFPHLLASKLHMEIATRADFPLPVLGLIHVANHITQHRPIPKTSLLDFHVWVEGCRPTKIGVEFDLHTEAFVDGACCWEEVTTVLSRAVEGAGGSITRPKPSLSADLPGQAWDLPSNWGRAYAQVSGDWNPIHLYAWTAKPFGFASHIAHGMALLAKVVADLPSPGDGPVVLSTQFEKPVYLPGSVIFQHAPERGGYDYVVRGKRPNMFGWYGVKP